MKNITNPHDIVFLIPNCKKYEEKANAIRNTWAKQLTTYGFRYYFLMGNSKLKQAQTINDILYVPCEDNYESLILKLVLGYEFLYQQMDFTYVYKIDDDCFPNLKKLINILLPQFNNKKYIGGAIHPKDAKMSNNWHFGKCENPKFDRPYKFNVAPFSFAKGGYGYFLRKDILPMLFELKDKISSELKKYIYSPEDVRIAEILKNNGILVDHIDSYSIISALNYNHSDQYLVYDIQDSELMQIIERDMLNEVKLLDLNTYVKIEKYDTTINFIVKSKTNNKKVAFYLYKNNKRIDIQWYSKKMSYTLDKKIHTVGTYKVRYFLVHENDTDPANSTEKEIGESETLYIE